MLDQSLSFQARERLKGCVERFRVRGLIEGNRDYTLAPFLATESLFVHVPKTAGVSVAVALYGCRAGGHRSLSRYRLALGDRFVDRAFKFAFVRNPWDRFVSAYHFLQCDGINRRDADFRRRVLARYPTFEHFVLGWLTPARAQTQVHFVPQFEFLLSGSNSIGLDLVARFESLPSDYQSIATRIPGSSPLVESNQSCRSHYREYYSARSRAIVADVYRRDIEAFNYEF